MNRNTIIDSLQSPHAYYILMPTPQIGGLRSSDLACVEVPTVSRSLRSDSIKRVEGLQKLTDDWDGYGGFAPSKTVCDHAYLLISRLALEFPDLPSPDITPSSNGTVLFTWGAEKGEAALEIGDAKYSGYIRRSGTFTPMAGTTERLGENELSAIAGCLF